MSWREDRTYRITFGMRGMEGWLRCIVSAPDPSLAINALLDKVNRKIDPVSLRIGEGIFEELNKKTGKYKRI